MTNTDIAWQLQHQARALAAKRDNLYRVRAYRRAAMAVLSLPRPVEEVGRDGLRAVPGIGPHLAVAISHFADTGEWRTYEELASSHLAV